MPLYTGDTKKKMLSSRPQMNPLDRKGSCWSLISNHSTSALSDTSGLSDSGIQYSDAHPDYHSVNSLKSGDSMNSLDDVVHLMSDSYHSEYRENLHDYGDALQRGGGTISESGIADIASVFSRSSSSAHTAGACAADSFVSRPRQSPTSVSIKSYNVKSENSGKDLPYGWKMRHTGDGRPYFINKKKRITTWLDPRTRRPAAATQKPGLATSSAARQKVDESPLPEGWEMGITDSGTPYFIDHIHRQTTWDDPRAKTRAAVVDSETQRQRLCVQQLRIASSEIRVQIETIRKKQAQLEQEMKRSASPETIKLAKARAHADAYNLVTLKAQHDTFQRQIESHMVQLHGENNSASLPLLPMGTGNSTNNTTPALAALSSAPQSVSPGTEESIIDTDQNAAYSHEHQRGVATPVKSYSRERNSQTNGSNEISNMARNAPLPLLESSDIENDGDTPYTALEDISGLLTPTMGGLVSPTSGITPGAGGDAFPDLMGVFDIGATTPTTMSALQAQDIDFMLNDMPVSPTGLFGNGLGVSDDFFGSWEV